MVFPGEQGEGGVHNPRNLRLESVKKCHFLEYSCIEIIVFGFFLGEEATAEVA